MYVLILTRSEFRVVFHLDLDSPGEATRPGPVGVPGEAVDISRDVTGDPWVSVPVPGPAQLRAVLQDLVPRHPDISQFLVRTQK